MNETFTRHAGPLALGAGLLFAALDLAGCSSPPPMTAP
jgi:hypothetical protein